MKLFTALAALSIIAAPAANAWGNGPQAAAAAYCGARSQGASQAKAEKAAKHVLVAGTSGRFGRGMAQIAMHGKSMMQATGYMAKQMCPEYFGSTSTSTVYQGVPGRVSDKSLYDYTEAAATSAAWGQF